MEGANSMTMISKTGIHSPTDQQDYFICRLCRSVVKTDQMLEHIRICHNIATDTERVE
jgi:hypothetical protein